MLKKVLLVSSMILLTAHIYGQDLKTGMTLDRVLQRAQSNSLDAFLQKHIYQARQWEYKSFLADRLPNLSLSMTPFDYDRSFVQRYNSQNDRDEYRERQSLYSYARMSLTQNLSLTGGTIYVDSDLGRLQNYGDASSKSYTTTPIRVGLIQPLWGYNRFRWDRKLQPLKFDKAKKQYVENLQEINLRGVSLFFAQAMAQLKEEMARTNHENSIILLEMGKKRYKIAAIKQNELLNLELNVLNAEIQVAQAEKTLKQSQFELNLFLDQDENTVMHLTLPQQIPQLTLDASQAMALAMKNNPLILEQRQRELEADQMVDKNHKESRFQANLVASYGLNQRSKGLEDAYRDPMDQQKVKISVDIPILDWGKRKGKYQMALSNREVTRLSVKQTRVDFSREITRRVIDFNLQDKLVMSARKANDIALKSYAVTLKLFKEGKASVLQLDDALRKQEAARSEYIQSMENYWKYYYSIQKLTLYDFLNDKPLAEL